ncbi:hypothetical protein BMS3Abin10_00211 [bacterium BMS3Abin10]|nr:hypothetical protein BMS3Abin10_00211 [bacterium BMS3Abin10]
MENKTTFLLKEYEECFNQLRYYDDRQLSLLKFSITISSSIATAILALYNIFGITSETFWLILMFLGCLVSFGLCLITAAMVQNRLYFIYPTRQVNAIRQFMISNNIPEFLEHNQMYLDSKFPAFKWRSIQTIMIVGNNVLATVYFALSILSFYKIKNSMGEISLDAVFWWSIIFFFLLFLSSSIYLIIKGKKNSDAAIHK